MTETKSRDQDDQCLLTTVIDRVAPGFFNLESGGRKPPIALPSDKKRRAPVTYLKGDAPTIISKFFRKSLASSKPFLNISPAELSLLTPKISLLKMVYNIEEPRQFLKQVPFIFRDHVGSDQLQRMFGSGRGRLGNVGIESFTMEQIGKTASVTNLYKVNITLFAESIEAFLTGAPDGSASYVDLITFSGKNSKSKIKDKNTGEQEAPDKIADPTYFEIKAVAGWAAPKDKVGMLKKEFKEALKYTEMVMKLNLVSHNISFNQDGTLKIDLEYKSKIESLMDSFRADIFHPSPLKKLEKDKIRKPDEKPSSSSEDKPDQPNKKAELESEITKEQIQKLYALFEPRIRYLSRNSFFSWKERTESNWQSKLATLEVAPKPMSESMREKLIKEAMEKMQSQQKAASGEKIDKDGEPIDPPPKMRSIPFVYLGDLIEAAVALAQDPTKAPSSVYKYRVLVGPLTFISRFTGDRLNMNLGQVPVSFHLFNDFINETIIKKGASRMTLMNFLKYMVQSLVLKSLGASCATPGTDLLQGQAMKSKVDMTIISHNTKKGKDIFKKHESSGNLVDVNQIGDSFNKKARLTARKSDKDQDALFDYLVIYASYLPTPYRSGNKREDEKDGVYHYFLGRDRGVVNNISFSKVNMPARRTYLMKKEVGPTDYLIERYNADIEMVGNPFVSVGQLIHINPSIASLGDSRNKNSYGTRLGLTGYYFITRLTHTITADNKFVTKLHCVGQGSFHGQKKPINKVSVTGSNKKTQIPKNSDNKDPKGKGPKENIENSTYGQTSNFSTASDAYAIMDAAAYGINSPTELSSGDSFIGQSEDVYQDRTPVPPGYSASVNSSTPRVLETCRSHDYAYPIAQIIIEYFQSILPPPGSPLNRGYDLNQALRRISGPDLMWKPQPITYSFDPGVTLDQNPDKVYTQVTFYKKKNTYYDVEDIKGNTEGVKNLQQQELKLVNYSINCFKHPTLGWYVYYFVENIDSASGGFADQIIWDSDSS